MLCVHCTPFRSARFFTRGEIDRFLHIWSINGISCALNFICMRLHLLTLRTRVFALFFSNELKFNIFDIPVNDRMGTLQCNIWTNFLNKSKFMYFEPSESVLSALCESKQNTTKLVNAAFDFWSFTTINPKTYLSPVRNLPGIMVASDLKGHFPSNAATLLYTYSWRIFTIYRLQRNCFKELGLR